MSQQDWLDVYLGGKTQLVNEPHKLMRMEPYRDVDGIAVFAPVHWDYLADNEPYINYFRTGDGLAVCNQFRYEEKARQNVQGDNYETSEMTPGGPDFAMAVEVLSFFHGDPNVITWTPYTVGRSFVTEHRRFARAFLALPAVQGKIVENAVSGDAAENVRVRTYPGTGGASYVSVCHKGYGKASFRVCVPADSGAVSVTDLVSGEAVPFEEKDGMISFNVDSGAMQLNSYKIAR